VKKFFQAVQKKFFFIFLLVLLVFLPGESFYEKLRRQTDQPLIKSTAVDLPTAMPYPVNQTSQPAPFLTSKSVVVIDIPSKVVILRKEPDFRLAPASTTKMMTALTALEIYQLNDALIVPRMPKEIGRHMDLLPGEQMTVENLLYGVLVQSANDAALTLAANYDGGEKEFINLMNKKVKELSLKNTHFVNVTGFDDLNHYSTSYDLAHLALEVLQNPVLSQMVNIRKKIVTDISEIDQHQLETTNELMGEVLGLQGVKTGWTELAGECLVSYIKRDDREIIIVLLGSQDRFSETKNLINWVFNNHQWQDVIQSIQN